MRNRALAWRKRFAAIVCAGVPMLVCSAFNTASATPQISPLLFSISDTSTRAIVLESVSMRGEPFSLNSERNFNAGDPQTRIELFCMNLDFLAGETSTFGNILVGDPSALTADAEDAAHNHYPLKVEYVAQVPPLVDANGNITTDFRGIYMVILRLNDAMTGNLGDVLIRLNLHGMASNRVRVGIGQVGGGAADDNPGVGTPAPATPPAMVTPLTIAQFQAQFSNAAFPSDQDRIRFLEQATWGPTDADLTHLRSIGMQAYLNEQFSAPDSGYPSLPLYPANSAQGCPTGSTATCLRDNYSMYPLQTQMIKNAVTGQDQLRQRVAFALHQFIVVGGNGLNNEASWMQPYLQTLDTDAFGNFRTILYDTTLNPGMGDYLDMVNNSRVAPNENYARELMQLFSIGVDKLNADGTPVLDAQGNRVPSYDQNDITSLARVFTGWILHQPQQPWSVDPTVNVPDYIHPMQLNATSSNTYDLAAKTFTTLSGGFMMPACFNCNLTNAQNYKTAELNQAIDTLFNHQNTGPYLCTQLIHQLVTSNPSPAYVGRCSATFANNGASVRGDMKAVITSILLDPEARGDVKTDPNYGHLREPVLLATNMLRSFNATTDGNLTTSGTREGLLVNMGQDLFNPPTVFSYYPADYGLPGAPLFGPEFGILNAQTTFLRANFINTLFLSNNGNGLPVSNPDRPTGTQFNISAYAAMTAQQLVDQLDTKLMHNTTSQSMRSSILTNLNNISSSTLRAQTAIYLVATSSQFQVER
jgi:uncharacterized protein (DUF1800 family)